MVARISAGKSGGLDYLEDGKDKNRLLSNGDVITRDMLDTRVTLQGDLRATKQILQSMKNDNYTKDYYHITHSFKENISIEEMTKMINEAEQFYLAGYDKSEYNIYTEYHIPKENAKYKLLTATQDNKKYYDLLSEKQAKEFIKQYPNKANLLEKRHPHTHTIIAKKNLLTNTQLKITEKDERTAINSFQEYINIKYALQSPKENKRDISDLQHKQIKFNNKNIKTHDFKNLSNLQTKKLLDNDIRNQILSGTINNYKQMVQYLKNQNYISLINEIKTSKNEYIKIKITGQNKYINLRAEVFTKEFYKDIKTNFDSKIRTINHKSLKDYEKDINTYKTRREQEVSKRYDTSRAKSLKINLIEQALKDKFENKTLSNTNENKIISDLDNGNSVFLTGGAGVGKSYTTSKIIKHYENKGLKVAKLGSTGIAATNINGQTLHSFFELGIKTNTKQLENEDKYKYDKIDKLNTKLRNTDLIVIDEISMVSNKQMEMIKYRLDNAHFKGKIMLVGDFNQLPPVSKNEKVGYAFESKAWKELNTKTHELTVIKRSDNKEFAQTLNRLRYGKINKSDNEMLKNLQKNNINEDKATFIYSTNKAVKEHNKQNLDKLKTTLETYKTTIKSQTDLNDEQKYKLLEETPYYKTLEIKKGSPVLITVNDKNIGVANGDKGIYLGKENNTMLVKLDRTNEIVKIEKKEVTSQIQDNDNNIKATISNYPIRPAYAITTHKSQGMSINYLVIDPNNQFEKNQFYVALSRANNPNNLKILPLNKKYKNNFQNIVKQDNKVLDFYHPNLRTKELKEFDKKIQDRQEQKKQEFFKSQAKKQENQKDKKFNKSNTLQAVKQKSKINSISKQSREKNELIKNKFKEFKDKVKGRIKDYKEQKLNISVEKLNNITKNNKTTNVQNNTQTQQNKITQEVPQKQLQKEKE